VSVTGGWLGLAPWPSAMPPASAFGMQAGFRSDQVSVAGRFSDYSRISDEVDRKEHDFHFCPDCGSTVFYTEPDEPDLLVVMTGSFADPSFHRQPRRVTTHDAMSG
jgi:hypothetical protein